MAAQLEILDDSNFLKLASSKTKSEEFMRIVDERVCGWAEKRRLVDGLAAVRGKVDAIQEKLVVAKAVGKAKGKLDEEEQILSDLYDALDLKDKVAALNTAIQTMIDEGKLTEQEKPLCIANLQQRIDKAKAGGKAQIVEKLENVMKVALKVTPVEVPVANLPKLFDLHKDFSGIARLQAKKTNLLTAEEKTRIATKDKVFGQMKALEADCRMWFETSTAFDGRLERALALRKVNLAEELKREAEEEAERDRLAVEERLEKKRQQDKAKEEQKAKEMMEKLEAKRKEAALKPVKPVPQKKIVEKHIVAMNPFELFADPKELREKEIAEELRAAKEIAAVEAKTAPTDLEKLKPEPEKLKSEAEKPTPEPAKPKPPVKAPAKPKPVIENKWGEPVALMMPEEDGADAGPSLADVAKMPPAKTKPAAQPNATKKKKGWGKVDASSLGFEC